MAVVLSMQGVTLRWLVGDNITYAALTVVPLLCVFFLLGSSFDFIISEKLDSC